jgi:putative hydroxymethylpyrimidine transport system permease protein
MTSFAAFNRKLFGWVTGIMVFGLIWQSIIWLTGVPKFILPSPLLVLKTLWTSREIIAAEAWVTFAEVIAGLLIGTVFGALTALLIFAIPPARKIFEPVMVVTQAIPVFALAPILTLWLGYGMGSKIFMAVLITYFPVASNFFDGLSRADRGWLDLAQTMGAKRRNTLWRIQVPAAIPSLMSGMRLATVYAPIGAVIGEWVGASRGLGYLMLLANGRVKIDLMFAALFVLAAFTVLLHMLVGHFAKRVSNRALGVRP